MVSEYKKLTAFDKVPKVFDGEVDGQQFTIEGAVLCLCWAELLGEERDGVPSPVNVLLQYCCSTAPTAQSEASAIMQVGAWGLGCTRRVASARACLIVLKAVVASSPQAK